jgi:hypothetical protein
MLSFDEPLQENRDITTMVAPLEHRDIEPLESVISSLRNQIEQERDFQESLLWKIRLLEREQQYCQRQVASFSRLLEIPREIVTLEKKDEILDKTLLSQRNHLRALLGTLDEEDMRRMTQGLLEELDRELDPGLLTERQETVTRILQAYVETGLHYMEKCQSRIATLSHRIEDLENELVLSRREEQKQMRMHDLSIRFHGDHEGATFGDFRAHIIHLLGVEMERELKRAIQRIPPL